ncbi:MAG: carboxypeptidase-like regulatory domain-containing protein [Tepidisphaeraceae bacterium]
MRDRIMNGATVVFFMLLYGTVPLHAAPATTQATRPNLNGTVTAEQKPVEGATVYVYTAGVRTGTSPYCPSCYADCGKRATTAADGTFTIPSLDPELIFRILVVAKGLEPQFVDKVDPGAGAIEARLKPRSQRAADANALRGRVVDEGGHPVVGAEVSPRGMKTKDTRWWGDTAAQIDQLAITDSAGTFELIAVEPDVAVDLQVRARGLVPTNFDLLPTGTKIHELKLIRGAIVTGRLTRGGKPLAGVAVGLVQADRGTGNFLGETIIGTAADGRFEFVNVKPDEDYFVYAKAASLPPGVASPGKSVRSPGNGKTSDVGDVVAMRGHVLRGTVRLSDGKPVPANTRVLLSRDEAWDAQSTTVGADGSFTINGVPPGERVSLSVRVRGYRMSASNASLDLTNRGSIEGKVDGDIEGLVMLLEPGQVDYNWLNAQPNQQKLIDDFRKVREGRIHGAEDAAADDPRTARDVDRTTER